MRSLSLPMVTLGASLALTTAALGQVPPSGEVTRFTGTPPRLLEVSTPYIGVNWPSPRYYFRIQVPPNGNSALGQITILPEVSNEAIAFDLTGTRVFVNNEEGEPRSIERDPATGAIAISLANPVPAGSLVTVALQALHNPERGGIHLFRVMAFPGGENPIALDLGVGQLTFFDR